MKNLIISFLLIFPLSNMFSSSKIDSILQVLHREIDKREVYYSEREKKIESFKSQLRKIESDHEKFNLCNYIFEEYESFQYDSAYVYAVSSCDIADRIQNKELFVKSRRNLLFCFMSSGLFKEACDIVNSVNTKDISNDLKADFYFQCARLYSNMASYNMTETYSKIYYEKKNIYCDSALIYLDSKSYLYNNIRAFKSLTLLDSQKKISIYNQLFRTFDMDNHQKAINSSILGSLYHYIGDNEDAIYYIALSAIYDTRSAITETTSKTTLAKYFYEKGDIENASKYINIALEEANYYNARHRKIDINTILPIIEKERLNTIKEQRNHLLYSLILVSVLLLSLLVTLIIIYKQIKKIKNANVLIKNQYEALSITNEKLKESNEIKDQYIIQALYGKSEYLEIVENLLKKIDRRLKARQYEELSSLYKEFNIKAERENVSSSFDQAFLKLFPNFIEDLNTLLKREERVILDQEKNLTPEIRIFALIRLGVDDNERISKFLNISINTIYAYKAKIKNKSIVPKEEFEYRIMQIKKKLN